jgi:hypothetical protein
MGDLYHDVSDECSASFTVTESGLRGCWSGWKSVCILKLEGIWQIIDLGKQKDGLVMILWDTFNTINTTFRTLPVSETSCWCGETVTNGKKSPKKHPWQNLQKLLSKGNVISKCSQSSPVEVNRRHFNQSSPTLSSRVRAFPLKI